VGKGVGRLWLPAHDPILHDKLDPLGGSVSAYRPQAVKPLAVMPCHNASLAQDLVAEVGAEAVLQIVEVTEAGRGVLSNGKDDGVELGREQPEVVALRLGDVSRRSGFVGELPVLHMEVVFDDGLLLDDVGGLAWPAACPQEEEYGFRTKGG